MSQSQQNLLNEKLGDIAKIKSEVPYGKDKKSRIDFLLTPKSSPPDKMIPSGLIFFNQFNKLKSLGLSQPIKLGIGTGK